MVALLEDLGGPFYIEESWRFKNNIEPYIDVSRILRVALLKDLGGPFYIEESWRFKNKIEPYIDVSRIWRVHLWNI